MCHAGVEEYVFFVGSKAFVSVSGYGIDEKKASRRMRLLSNEYCIDYSQLSAVYENGLKHELEDVERSLKRS
ncbi:MAG: hypothetical protein IJS17_06335 [Clostridia bacterium]|nr:hypothetical protein [Clostridia bacterium]